MIKEYTSIKDVAILLNVSKLTLRNWDKNKKLCAQRHPVNNYRVYLKTEIDEIIEQIKSGEKKIKYTKIKNSKENIFKSIWKKLKK